jgi:hypothetical protein
MDGKTFHVICPTAPFHCSSSFIDRADTELICMNSGADFRLVSLHISDPFWFRTSASTVMSFKGAKPVLGIYRHRYHKGFSHVPWSNIVSIHPPTSSSQSLPISCPSQAKQVSSISQASRLFNTRSLRILQKVLRGSTYQPQFPFATGHLMRNHHVNKSTAPILCLLLHLDPHFPQRNRIAWDRIVEPKAIFACLQAACSGYMFRLVY